MSPPNLWWSLTGIDIIGDLTKGLPDREKLFEVFEIFICFIEYWQWNVAALDNLDWCRNPKIRIQKGEIPPYSFPPGCSTASEFDLHYLPRRSDGFRNISTTFHISWRPRIHYKTAWPMCSYKSNQSRERVLFGFFPAFISVPSKEVWWAQGATT